MPSTPKILLVDDVDFFLEMEMELLKRTPATLLTARNGVEALEVARRERPQLIYMDVAMPEMDGLACCRAIKADPELRRIPVIMVFTPTRDVDLSAAAAAGAEEAITKPVDRKLFLDLGHRYLFDIERREKRASCQTTVDFRIAGRDYQGLAHDLSRLGLYIEYRDPIPESAFLYLSFLLPTVSPRRVEARGRVAWINQGFPRTNLKVPQGFGVEFQNIDEEALDTIRQYIDRYGENNGASPGAEKA